MKNLTKIVGLFLLSISFSNVNAVYKDWISKIPNKEQITSAVKDCKQKAVDKTMTSIDKTKKAIVPFVQNKANDCIGYVKEHPFQTVAFATAALTTTKKIRKHPYLSLGVFTALVAYQQSKIDDLKSKVDDLKEKYDCFLDNVDRE